MDDDPCERQMDRLEEAGIFACGVAIIALCGYLVWLFTHKP